MSMLLGSQHLALFSINAVSAADITTDQRNIFDRPITLAEAAPLPDATGQGAANANQQESSEWLRKAETYRSTAQSSEPRDPAPDTIKPVDDLSAAPVQMAEMDAAMSQPVAAQGDTASSATADQIATTTEPIVTPAAPPSAQQATPSRPRGLAGLILRW